MVENFDLGSFDLSDGAKQKKARKNGELSMSVSPICRAKDGTKFAYVSFSDDVRTAEGKIPSCEIVKNNGFAEIEVAELERYMKDNLKQLKDMAAGIHIMDAFMS